VEYSEYIAEGLGLLRGPVPGGLIGLYRIQAAITAVHDEAPGGEATDGPESWRSTSCSCARPTTRWWRSATPAASRSAGLPEHRTRRTSGTGVARTEPGPARARPLQQITEAFFEVGGQYRRNI